MAEEMNLIAETTQLTRELVHTLVALIFTSYVDLRQSRAAAHLRGARGTPKWVRVKISSTIIHGTPPISTIPPPCEKSALHCSVGRKHGGSEIRSERRHGGEGFGVKEKSKDRVKSGYFVYLFWLMMKRGCNMQCAKYNVCQANTSFDA